MKPRNFFSMVVLALLLLQPLASGLAGFETYTPKQEEGTTKAQNKEENMNGRLLKGRRDNNPQLPNKASNFDYTETIQRTRKGRTYGNF